MYNKSIMDEKELKTSTGQRVAIILIAILMLGSVIAGYVAIVASGSGSANSTEISEEKAQEYREAYAAELAEFQDTTKDDYAKFAEHIDVVGTYDEDSANSGGVVTKDYLEGDGRELTDGDGDYLAYYIGWCADGSVFDSTVDDVEDPSGFVKVLSASQGMIQGWTEGVLGMKLGGIRRITIPGEQAYGSSKELCGGYNKPLRFLVMAVASEDSLITAADELELAGLKARYANYGIDYEKLAGQ